MPPGTDPRRNPNPNHSVDCRTLPLTLTLTLTQGAVRGGASRASTLHTLRCEHGKAAVVLQGLAGGWATRRRHTEGDAAARAVQVREVALGCGLGWAGAWVGIIILVQLGT